MKGIGEFHGCVSPLFLVITVLPHPYLIAIIGMRSGVRPVKPLLCVSLQNMESTWLKGPTCEFLNSDIDTDSKDNSMSNSELSKDYDTLMCLHILDKDKFNFFYYSGKVTDKFVQSLHKLHAPCEFISTLKKTKDLLSTLKVHVPDMLQSI